jgi:Zn/Cd-binding protein ZinT
MLGLGFVASVVVTQGISQAYEIKTNKKLRCDRKKLGVHFCFKCSNRSSRYSRILNFSTSIFVL